MIADDDGLIHSVHSPHIPSSSITSFTNKPINEDQPFQKVSSLIISIIRNHNMYFGGGELNNNDNNNTDNSDRTNNYNILIFKL